MVNLDSMTPAGRVRAIALSLSLYYYAAFDGEVIPWPDVQAHDMGRTCHCPLCLAKCLVCVADRNHPAAAPPANGDMGPRLNDVDPTNGPIRPEDDPQDSGREYA
jgi:hypothetical protein